MRKSTLWTMRKVSTRISLSMPHRPTRIDTFRLLWIFCFRNNYSIHLSPLDGMCQRRLIWSIHYTDVYRRSCILGHFEKKCVGTCRQCLKGATPLVAHPDLGIHLSMIGLPVDLIVWCFMPLSTLFPVISRRFLGELPVLLAPVSQS